MKRVIFSSFSFFSCLFITAQTTITGGSVLSGTWTQSGSPYNIMGTVMIPNDSTLTIQPGVTVNFQGTFKLLVAGQLLAIGTPSDSILFTAANTANGWRGLRFDNTSANNDSSILAYCIIQYGKATGASPDNDGGGIYINNFSKIAIRHSRISNCTALSHGCGIYCYNSSARISENNICYNIATNASYGGGGVYNGGGHPFILNNYIHHNTASGSSGGGGGGIDDEGYASIIGNTITQNYAYQSSGGGISAKYSSSTIFNNIISNNAADGAGGGIRVFGSHNITNNMIVNNQATAGGGGIYSWTPTFTLTNNVIANNTSAGPGGAIYSINSSPLLINNTLANNSAMNGGAIYLENSSNPLVHNCILWGNTVSASGQEIYLFDEGSDPNFYNCDIQGGSAAFALNSNFYSGTYTSNIDQNPLFIAPTSGSGTAFNALNANWALQNFSPCIDSGSSSGLTLPAVDIAGNTRVQGANVDMGAYESAGMISINDHFYNTRVYVAPNPFNNHTVIHVADAGPNLEWKLYNTFGELVASETAIRSGPLIIYKKGLATGMYILLVKANDTNILNEKVVITD